ncbi:MAG: CinA family protein [Muribaculaceae bacterium]|nr:CinA family protein [Muribaculaceae bacterium]
MDALRERGMTMATAESCTGGNIAHLITSVPGSSEIFNGGVVSYANSAKINVLGVSPDTLAEHGAVSEATVRQMADGAARVLGTDFAVATSGIAGPGGGTPDKPVGTVWIGVHTPSGTFAEVYRFPGHRDRVIARASATALINLLKSL